MPPNGTADLARSAVSGPSRRPAPPARTTPRIRCRAIGPAHPVPYRPADDAASRRSASSRCSSQSRSGRCRWKVWKCSGMCSASSFQASVSTVSSRARSAQLTSRPSRSSEPGAGRFPIGVVDRLGLAVQPLDDPLQHPDVLAEAGPDELAAGVLAEPVHVVQLRQLGRVGGGLADLQPVAEVVAHVVAAERQHRERVVPQLADRALGRGGLLRGDVRARGTPRDPSRTTRSPAAPSSPPAAEQDRRDRHPGRVVPLRRDDRALGRRAW